MALTISDRIKETSNTTGTGTYTLAGAVTGFETFTANLSNSDTTYYCCTDNTDFEVGLGTFTTSGTTLARTTILASSNSNNAVSWTSGTRTLFCTLPAAKTVFLDASGNTTIGGVVTIGSQLIMPDVTSAKILVADGTSYQEVAVSGDVTIANTGAVTIGSGVVETSMIAADAITAGLIGDNVINSEHYAAGSIDLEHMSANSVDSDQYVDGSIDLIHMSANSVDSDQYVDGSIDLVHMSVNSVDSDQYVDGSIDTAHIADAQITVAKMAVNSVDSDQYVDGSIDTAHISADAITGAKIADDAIDSEHYADGSIDTAHIANLQITTGLIAADAITGAKIADDVIDSEHYAAGSIDTEHIADANVTLAKIANQAANTVLVRDANSSGVVSAKAVATTQILIGDGTGFTAAALSGDVTMTNAGVVTIAANAVEGSMLNTDVISGQTALSSGLADADELLVSDAGTIKKMAVSVLKAGLGAATLDDATALAIALG